MENKINKKQITIAYILSHCSIGLDNTEVMELETFLQKYILPLSIIDYVAINPETRENEGCRVLINTGNKIGEICFFRNEKDEDKFQCIFRIFLINKISQIEILSFGDSWNKLLIESINGELIDVLYRSDDHETIRFIQQLL